MTRTDRPAARWAPMLLTGLALFATGCDKQEARKQYLEFESFTLKDGVYRPKPGWTFTKGKNDTIVAMRANDGVVITPCECAIEDGHTTSPGGHCAQAHHPDDGGPIKEVWCADNGCGFCVGGTAEPDDPASSVRFDVVCLNDRKLARQ